MKEFLSTNAYCRRAFGEKVYKIALSGAVSCPNRADGSGGCAFCSEGGSGDFAVGADEPIDRAVELAKARLRRKTDAEKFIAYFQSFTGTYGDLSHLEARYAAAAARADIAALSIATRPDCLGADALAMLERLSKIKPLWIELGLQTVHDQTAQAMGRGYPTEMYDRALAALRPLGVHIITHVIFGLPGESTAQMMQTVRYVGDRSDGIKFHLLHVLRGTRLATMYAEGQFQTLEKDAYIHLVVQALEALPASTVIHRLTGDAPRQLLISPLWSTDKKGVLNTLRAQAARQGIRIL